MSGRNRLDNDFVSVLQGVLQGAYIYRLAKRKHTTRPSPICRSHFLPLWYVSKHFLATAQRVLTSKSLQPSHTTVLVIGGGPGGSYSASVLAREKIDVTVVEAAQFPR